MHFTLRGTFCLCKHRFFFFTISDIKRWAFKFEEHEFGIRVILADAAGWYQSPSLSLAVLVLCEDSDAICVSQNHRMFGVGRDLCGSSSPILLSKQGHLQ